MIVWQGILTVGASVLMSAGSLGATSDRSSTEPIYRSPSWSPDGTSVVYEQAKPCNHTKLLIKNLQTDTVRELTTASDEIAMRPKWSPQGNKILYTDSADQVYTIWADGSHRTVISDGDSYEAAWSPDGKRIAFVEDVDSVS